MSTHARRILGSFPASPALRVARRASLALVCGLALLGQGCASTGSDDDYDGEDIEVHVPTQQEADAAAAARISASNADDEYEKLLEELSQDQ
jgi:hypothetical protein